MKNRNSFVRSFLYELIGLLIFAVVSTVLFFVNEVAGLIALTGTIVYSVIILVLYFKNSFGFYHGIDGNALSTLITGMVEKIDSPVMIVNEANRIVWCNDEFASLSEVKDKRITSGAGKLFGGYASYANMSAAYEEFTDLSTSRPKARIMRYEYFRWS